MLVNDQSWSLDAMAKGDVIQKVHGRCAELVLKKALDNLFWVGQQMEVIARDNRWRLLWKPPTPLQSLDTNRHGLRWRQACGNGVGLMRASLGCSPYSDVINDNGS